MRQKRRAAAQVFNHPHRGLHQGITPKLRVIVEVFVATAQAIETPSNKIAQAVLDEQRIAWIGKRGGHRSR
jgi:hypothetical protein